MFRELWRKKVLIVFAVALLVLFPSASVRPAQALSKTIFLSVGLEKASDGYTVTGAVVVNQFSQSGETTTKMISADGKTINEAFKKITADQGREASLAHCNLIVLGATLEKENVAELLEYFIKKFEMSNNALLVWTDGEVEKTLETSINNKTGMTGGLLESVSAYNQENVFKRPMTLDIFYKDYLRGRKGVMNFVKLKDDEIVNTKQTAVFSEGLFEKIEDYLK